MSKMSKMWTTSTISTMSTCQQTPTPFHPQIVDHNCYWDNVYLNPQGQLKKYSLQTTTFTMFSNLTWLDVNCIFLVSVWVYSEVWGLLIDRRGHFNTNAAMSMIYNFNTNAKPWINVTPSIVFFVKCIHISVSTNIPKGKLWEKYSNLEEFKIDSMAFSENWGHFLYSGDIYLNSTVSSPQFTFHRCIYRSIDRELSPYFLSKLRI